MELLSGNNDKMDIKAWLGISQVVIALLVYAAYAVKGLLVHWEMPAGVQLITASLLLSGSATGVSTLWNQKLGVTATASVTVKEAHEAPGPVG